MRAKTVESNETAERGNKIRRLSRDVCRGGGSNRTKLWLGGMTSLLQKDDIRVDHGGSPVFPDLLPVHLGAGEVASEP